jgi:hypothetical protein
MDRRGRQPAQSLFASVTKLALACPETEREEKEDLYYAFYDDNSEYDDDVDYLDNSDYPDNANYHDNADHPDNADYADDASSHDNADHPDNADYADDASYGNYQGYCDKEEEISKKEPIDLEACV